MNSCTTVARRTLIVRCALPILALAALQPVGAAVLSDASAASAHPAPADASAPAASGATSAASQPAPAAGPDWWRRLSGEVEQTWHSDRNELFVPLHTWHNRHMYSAEKIAGYNENPWGIGAGKYRYDDRGNWHALYAMAFLDSHSKLEPIAGYGYEKIWRPGGDWRLGLGFTAGLTARDDYHYYPIPLILPLVSVGFGRFTLQSTYVPGGKGYGNILFTWMRWQF